MKTALLAILLFSTILATNVAPPAQPFPFQQAWKISIGRAHGSMVPVQKRKDGTVFLTAKHVAVLIKKVATAYHPNYGTVTRGIRVLKMHPTLDLATVFVPIIDDRIIPPAAVSISPKLGDPCMVVGYPGPGKRRITGGYICGPNTFSAQVIGGSSGGPVFNKAGQLIGIVRAVDMKRLGFGNRIAIQWMGHMVPVTRDLVAEMLR